MYNYYTFIIIIIIIIPSSWDFMNVGLFGIIIHYLVKII